MPPLDLAVAICTSGRPAMLADLLASLAAAGVAAHAREVVLVDNDRAGSARDVAAAAGLVNLRRVHLPEPNIAAARNRAVAETTAGAILFVDDDQRVAPDFFARLAAAWASRPEGVAGMRLQVTHVVEGAPSAWTHPHATLVDGRPATRRTFATNGVVLTRAALEALSRPGCGGPFDPDFGLRGGSDTELFVRLRDAGLQVVETTAASLVERVPAARAGPRHALRSAFRIGFGNALIDLRRGARADVWRGAWRPLAGLLLRLPGWAPRRDAWPEHLRQAMYAAGRLWALAGRDFEHYRRDGLGWVVFGDDWGRHPSTTQHLVAHLPREDRVLWVDSLGMRAPRLRPADLRRIVERLRRPPPLPAAPPTSGPTLRRVRPLVLPWHRSPLAVAINRLLLRVSLRAAPREPIVLASSPVAVRYLDGLRPTRVLYLRLDRYADVPGVDPALVAAVEGDMLARADVVIGPNADVLAGVPPGKARLVPQGVDPARFAAVPARPPGTRVCGYWGWLGDWLDVDLLAAVARARPDWTFELRGPARLPLATFRVAPNVVLLPAVPHDRLAAAAAHWQAAWAPFARRDHIVSASPLKLREYLAAGFASAATPFAEARALPEIALVADPSAACAFLDAAAMDTEADRRRRRASVAADGWGDRAAVLRALASAPSFSPGKRQVLASRVNTGVVAADAE